MSSRATPAANSTGRGGTAGQRLRARVVGAGSWLACRLPEGPLVRLADASGRLWYRLAPGQAAQARRNLARVAIWLAAEGIGSPAGRAAAEDPAALERLVRAAFRHRARYYLELARAPTIDERFLTERLEVESPDVVARAFGESGGTIFLSAHFGPVELPAYILVHLAHRPATAPMETIDDPPLQGWFARTRGAVGIRIVGLREAHRELTAALRRGEAVGMVADRDVSGGGVATTLFGATARLPAGPALFAIETGSPVYFAAVRRTGIGRYRGWLAPLAVPADGQLRERVRVFLENEARLIERAVAAAPEQWWAVFFPIWADTEEGE